MKDTCPPGRGLGSAEDRIKLMSSTCKPLLSDSNTNRLVRGCSASDGINVDEFRRRAQKRLPRVVFDYVDGAAEDEVTLRANRQAYSTVTFRPHQAVHYSNYVTSTRVLGAELSFPVLLAPVGYTRLLHPDGDIGAAKAAGDAGTICIQATSSGHSLEEVRHHPQCGWLDESGPVKRGRVVG